MINPNLVGQRYKNKTNPLVILEEQSVGKHEYKFWLANSSLKYVEVVGVLSGVQGNMSFLLEKKQNKK